jgi:hypothetical protein
VHELRCDQLNTTKELLDIATWHTSGEEAVGAAYILGYEKTAASGSWTAPSKATIKGARKGAKGKKKGLKRHPRWVVVATSSNDDDKEEDDSDKEYVTAIERGIKR